MTDRGRRFRLAATATVLTALLAGSLWGSDDQFPLGPFRMYATSARPTGAVRTASLSGVTTDGRTVAVRPGALGLRRAELEGQYPRFQRDPELLGALARAYAERWDVGLVELRLEQSVRRVVDRRVQPGEEVEVVARWRA